MKMARECQSTWRAVPVLMLGGLSACGGGGGGSNPPPPSPPPPPPPSVTIGGTVTGLTAGAVVLQNNAGDDLSITADGAFSFPDSITSGSTFSVTVREQPPGPDCTVTSGSGTATANVTNVSVVCTVDPATVFLPFSVTPHGTGVGTLDLNVVSSKSLSGTPIRVATDWGFGIGYTEHLAREASNRLRSDKPAALIYASDTNNLAPNTHLFALDLSGGSSLVPRQLSSLTVTSMICEAWIIYADLDDPESAFLLVGVGTGDMSSPCQASPFDYYRIRLSDSATTDPFALTDIPQGTKHFLYAPDGSFAGMVVGQTTSLYLYHDDSFTTRTALLEDVGNFTVLPLERASSLGTLDAEPTMAMLHVTRLDGSGQVFRVDHTRSISDPLTLGQFDGFASAQDEDYLYLTNTVSTFPTVQDFLRLRLDGSAAAELLHTHEVPEGDLELWVAGVIDDELVLVRQTEVDNEGHRTSNLLTLSKLAPSTPEVIATFEDITAVPTVHRDLLFVNLTRVTPGASPTFSEETTVLRVDGGVVQEVLPDSWFTGLAGGAMQRGRDQTPDEGARLESLAVQDDLTLESTILTRADGSPFRLSAGSTFPFVLGVSSSIAAGGTGDSDQSYGLAFDLSQGAVEEIRVPASEVLFVTGL